MAQPVGTRTCIGCRQKKDKKQMLRIVCREGNICCDAAGNLEGRGAYICRDIQCLNKAKKNKGLERTFRRAVDGSIYVRIEEEYAIDK